MDNKDYIVAIDLGDSNIVVAVGSAADGSRINIEHILSRPSEGVSAGQIVNIDLAVKTIKGALEELEESCGIKVLEVYAGISGEFIYCTSHTDHVYVPDHKNGVTQQVVENLFERMANVMVAEDRYIMERIPQRYVINDTTEVDNPVGVFGSPLSSTFNFISSDNIPLSRLDMAIRRLNLVPRRTFSNAVVVGDAVLSPDEKEEGVVVVDLGSELTDIAIYNRNVLRYISTIPIGAKAINNDIKTLTIPERHVERFKLKYGCAMSKNAPTDLSVTIKGRTRHDQREIPVYNLAAVIEARARDIAELVAKEISDSGFVDRIPYGIVLTGGSAQLRSLDELFREVTGLDVRVAEAEDVISPQTRTKITSSADSTVVGLLLHGLKYGACAVEIVEPKAVPPMRSFPTQESSNPFAPVTESAPEQSPAPLSSQIKAPQAAPTVATPLAAAPKQESQISEAPRSINRVVVSPTPQVQPMVKEVVREVAPKEEVKITPAPEIAPAPTPIAAPSVEVTPEHKPAEPTHTPSETEEAKPKRRILKLFSSLTSGANTFAESINSRFDVDDEV